MITPSVVIVQVALDWACFAVAVHVAGGPAVTVVAIVTFGEGVKFMPPPIEAGVAEPVASTSL